MATLVVTFKAGAGEDGFADTMGHLIKGSGYTDGSGFSIWLGDGQYFMMDSEQDQQYAGIGIVGKNIVYKYQGQWIDAYSYSNGWTSESKRTVFFNTSNAPRNAVAYIQALEKQGLVTISGGTMPNTYNKVVINGTTYIDLSGDDVTPSEVLATVSKFHNANGEEVAGTIASKTAATYNVSSSNQTIASGQYLSGTQTIRGVTTSGISAANIKTGVTVKVGDSADDDRIVGVTGTYTSDATAQAGEILSTKTAYVNGTKLTGSMANNGGNNVTVTNKTGTTIPTGFYDGSGKAVIDSTSSTNLVAGNIKQGVTILGVEGTLAPGYGITTGTANVTPAFTAQTLLPSTYNLDYFDEVDVAAISVTETLTTGTTGYTVTVS